MFPSTITREEAITKISRLNGINGLTVEKESIDLVIAEYLRKTLCSLAGGISDHASDFRPIYITSLTNVVRRQLAPLWPELNLIEENSITVIGEQTQTKADPLSDPIRRVLETLMDLRDVIEVGNGYWLPTPVRLIQLPEKEKVFVVGGSATADLSRILGAEVKLSGFIRYVVKSSLSESVLRDKTWWQSYEEWLGNPPIDLKIWMEMILSKAKRNLHKSASDFTSFEVYVPAFRKVTLQYYRWVLFEDYVRNLNTLPSDLVLCRTVSQHIQLAPTKYWIGSITLTSLKNESPVSPKDVRRMMYGFDFINEASVQAVWEPEGVINLKNWLPPQERRLLIALGRDISPEPGRLPLKYQVKPEWKDLIISALEKLRIHVIN